MSRYLSLIIIQTSRVTIYQPVYQAVRYQDIGRQAIVLCRQVATKQKICCQATTTSTISCFPELSKLRHQLTSTISSRTSFQKENCFDEEISADNAELVLLLDPRNETGLVKRPSDRNSITDFIECIAVIVHCTNESSSQC